MTSTFIFPSKQFVGADYFLNDSPKVRPLFDLAADLLIEEGVLQLAESHNTFPYDPDSYEYDSLMREIRPFKAEAFLPVAGSFDSYSGDPRSVLFMERDGTGSFVYDYKRREIVFLVFGSFVVRGEEGEDLDSEYVFHLAEGASLSARFVKPVTVTPSPRPQVNAPEPKIFSSDFNYGARFLNKNEEIYVNNKANRALFEELMASLPMAFRLNLSNLKEEVRTAFPSTFQRDLFVPLAGIYIKGSERFREALFAYRRKEGAVLAIDIAKRHVVSASVTGADINGKGLSFTYDDLLKVSHFALLAAAPKTPEEAVGEERAPKAKGTPSPSPNYAYTDKIGGISRYDFGDQANGSGAKVLFNGLKYRDRFMDFESRFRGRGVALAKSAAIVPADQETVILAKEAISAFSLRDYFSLCGVFDRYGSLRTVLLTRRDGAGEIVVLNPANGKVYAFSTIGCVYDGADRRIDYEGLLKMTSFQPTLPPREKKRGETPPKAEKQPEESPKSLQKPLEIALKEKESDIETAPSMAPTIEALEEPVAQAEEPVMELPEEPGKEDMEEEPPSVLEETSEAPISEPARRLWARGEFLRHLKSFSKRHRAIIPRIDNIFKNLLTSDKDRLEQFIGSKRLQPMVVKGTTGVYKFRLSQAGELKGSRLFFSYGGECDFLEEAAPGDIVLLEFSEPSEHDEQGEIAEVLSRKLNDPEDDYSELTFAYMATPQNPSISLHPTLSHKQKRAFHDKPLPLVLTGSAGTGKTLISIEAYREEKRKDPASRVLYVTYFAPLAEKVGHLLKELDGEEAESLSLGELFQGIAPKGLAGREHFHAFFASSLKSRDKKNLIAKIAKSPSEAESIAYTFFRGVLSGSALLRDRPFAKKALSKEEFLDLTKGEEALGLDAREAIHKLGADYMNRLSREGLLTDNLAARRVLSQASDGVYDAIVIDEAQDLTELTLLAVARFLKEGSHSLYLFGDDNQAINPTLFRLRDASKCLHFSFPDAPINAVSLKEAYRSSEFLVSFINLWNAYKKDAIGAYGLENDALETGAKREAAGSEPRLLLGEPLAEATYRQKALLSGDTVFIFPSFDVKESFAQKHPDIDSSLLYSIEEAKGLEWDNVILVDFLSSRRATYERMLSGDAIGRHSTIHRMLFNRFYVALTRAKDRILLVESSPGDLLMDKILDKVPAVKTAEEAAGYLADDLSNEEWLRLAETRLSLHQFALAKGYLKRIDAKDYGPREKRLSEDISLYEQKEKYLKGRRKDAAPYLEMLIRRKDRDYLRNFYQKRNESDILKVCQGLMGKPQFLSEIGHSLALFMKRADSLDSEREYWADRFLEIASRLVDSRLKSLMNLERR